MPWFANSDGTATYETHDSAAFEQRSKTESFYATLTGTILHHGVLASAFRHPVKACPLYDAQTWLETGQYVEVGMKSDYRVEATSRHGLLQPPVSPADLP